MSNVFIAFQDNDESRPVVDAIIQDNPAALLTRSPGLVKIDSPSRLVIKRETIEAMTEQDFDLQRIHINLITLSGHIDEDDDEISLTWKH